LDYKKRFSSELTTLPVFRDEQLWNNGDLGIGPDLQDILSPDQAYEGLYGQGPNGTGNGRAYQQGYDTLPIDSMQGLEIGGSNQQQQNLLGLNTNPPTSPSSYQMDMECVIGEMDASELTFQHHLGVDSMMDTMPSPPANDNNCPQAAWYDTDLWAVAAHFNIFPI